MTLQKTINISSSSHNRLSVQIALTGLSFLITSQDGTVINSFQKSFKSKLTPEEVLIELRSLFKQEIALQGSFEKVKLVYHNSNYTLVPEVLFDESKLSEYLKFNTKILGNDHIVYDEIGNHELQVVYIPLVNINNYLFDRFGSFEFYHAASILLKSLLDKERHQQLTKAYVHVGSAQFDLVIVENGALQMCNSYLFETPEDFIYYILFAFEQLKINPDSVSTLLFGNINDQSDLYEIAYTYIRNVGLQNSSTEDTATSNNFLLRHVLEL